MKNKKWVYLNKEHTREEIMHIAQKFGIAPIIATILLNRKIRTDEEIGLFLKTGLEDLRNPMLLQGMEEAVDRILEAVDNGEKITVYGDYDVDGITSSAVLTDYLTSLGASADYYIPDRIDEGYGINSSAIERIAAKGTGLIVTVDCGITAKEEVEHARRLGVDVVITDHHQCKEDYGLGCAVVNPNKPDCEYPFKELAGVGIVFKLITAIAESLGQETSEVTDKYVDLVALGTIADVVRLVDENRLIVNYGLNKIKHTKNIGLKSILEASGLDFDKPLTAGAVGFIVAPRINAAGRIGDPNKAVELFLTKDDNSAKEIAIMLNEENRRRQETEQEILQQAVAEIEGNPEWKSKKIIVLANYSWHHGVVGIVASRITERYNKPCILISLEEDMGKGSGRSIRGFNLYKALEESDTHLVKYGGHELAAGLTIHKADIEKFTEQINEYADRTLGDDDMIPYIHVDCMLPVRFITEQTAEKLSMLEPFGMGNPIPTFALTGLTVQYIAALKDNKHIRMTLVCDGRKLDAFGFNMGEYKNEIKVGDVIDILFQLNINVYRGERNIQLILKDIRF